MHEPAVYINNGRCIFVVNVVVAYELAIYQNCQNSPRIIKYQQILSAAAETQQLKQTLFDK
jgi:hypothetical protein